MIDNYSKAMELMHRMEEKLPMIVHPGSVLIQTMRERGIKLTSDQELPIERVHYLGDEGGIGCGIMLDSQGKDVMVVSLTQLRVIPDQPLTKDIWAYQLERSKKLAERDGLFKPFEYTVKPSKKRKKKKK